MPGTLSDPLYIIVLDPQNMILGDMLAILYYYNKSLSHSTYKEKMLFGTQIWLFKSALGCPVALGFHGKVNSKQQRGSIKVPPSFEEMSTVIFTTPQSCVPGHQAATGTHGELSSKLQQLVSMPWTGVRAIQELLTGKGLTWD